MKNLGILAMSIVVLFSCKETPKNDTSGKIEDKKANTYAEISIGTGGSWEGRKYVNRTGWENVNSFEVPAEHTDHSFDIRYEGPGWENSKIGYRLYLDWRNAIDIFGKKVDSIVLPFVGVDGFDSYHEPAPWGQDILKAGKSMGIGGFGCVVADTVVHFQKVNKTSVKINNTDTFSNINIKYENWNTSIDSLDLEASLTIYPEDRFTKVVLSPSKETEGICTGIVKLKEIPLDKKEGQKWGYIATYGAQTLVSDTDLLGMAVFYKIAELAEQKEGNYDHLLVFKPSATAITYYFLGAWEQELDGIKNKEDFMANLNKKLDHLEANDAMP